ncbi:MAG: hypothetical protein IJQ65_08775, partial [Kiritimatiellae bacterium]|nr:hypothetical protein [Kiritimatiellia bacterium]
MKRLAILVCACAATGAFAAVPGTYTARDYVQNGLVAQWDGREFGAYDIHAASSKFWADLVGRRNIVFNNSRSYTDDGVYCDGDSARWAKSYCGDFSCFEPSEDGITVEIAATIVAVSGTHAILTAQSGTGVAILKAGENVVLASAEKGATPVLAHGLSNGEMLRLSVGYRNGEVVDGNIFLDGVPAARSASTGTGGSCSSNVVYMYRDSIGRYGNMTIHSVRVYNRLLNASEAAANAKVDRCRFSMSPCFEVVSGTVTADGVAYAAGDKVYSARGSAAEVTAAEGAVIRPVADGSARIAVTGCSLAFEAVAADEMVYVESLELGEGASLAMPSTGLGVNAASLTAAASAEVTGQGLLVSAAQSCPVASLTGGVTYRPAGGSFDGWPASGVAYVPAGSAPAVSSAADVESVEALDAIVFLDDGTAAADATTVSVGAAGKLHLSAKVNGPGVIAASSGGGVEVSGNNARFLGNFDFSGVDVEVSDEHGLGSSVTRPAKIVRGETSSLVFDNGASVFTNYAKLWINNADRKSYRVIGSASAEKKLVLAETLEFGDPVGGNTYIYLDYNIDLLKGYRTGETATTTHPRLSAFHPGECHIYGAISHAKSGYGWIIRENTHYHQSVYSIGRVNQNASKITCEAPDVFLNSNVAPSSYGKTLDLNGYDQHVAALNVYNNVSASESGNATHVITSAVPAKIVVMGSAFTSRPMFVGKAGFEYAASGTNVFAGVASTSDGELKVSRGTLALRNGYSWVGNATVTGGRLLLESSVAIVGGKTVLSIEGDGVVEVVEGAGCSVAKIVGGGTVVDEPGVYTVAELRARGVPIEGPDAFVVNVVRSYDVEWEGWPTTPGATAVVPKNTTVYIYESDVPNVAALGTIDMGPGSVVVCSGLSEGFALPQTTGFGTFAILDTDGVVLSGDSSGLTAPGGFLISNSCVAVSNRYGLGSSQSAAARVYCGTKSDVLTFGGEGLTNDVPLQIWPGTGANGGFLLGSRTAGEVFVQNADLTLMTGNSLSFRNSVRFTAGILTYEYRNSSGVYHFYPSVVNGALGQDVWLDEGSTLDTGNRRLFTAGGIWHLGGTLKGGTFNPQTCVRLVCEKDGALAGRTFDPYAAIVLDLNGYNQDGIKWDSTYGGSLVLT